MSKRAAIEPGQVQTMSEMFDLLSDPTRLRLLLALLERGEVQVGKLANVTDVSESAVSHALRLLKAHSIVASRRDGRKVLYRLSDDHVARVLKATIKHVRGGIAASA